jgi:protein-S-isoprenylcysteine O-methyltransferase Ste14
MFSLSRNINYFGDTVLYTGWAAATGWWPNVWVPVLMTMSFYLFHIRDKEAYLAKR